VWFIFRGSVGTEKIKVKDYLTIGKQTTAAAQGSKGSLRNLWIRPINISELLKKQDSFKLSAL
jgi:hypothetical protein